MPLSAQRFQDNDTLNRCVDSGYRMYRGERDKEAVKRVQLALFDLCYPQITKIDGIWGSLTDKAVVQFKTEENLHPTDPVASRGTIGQLDMYFAWEPAFPDHPDPTVTDLVELAQQTAAQAAAIAEQTLAALEGITWGGPASSPDEAAIRSALLTHTGIDAGSAAYETELQRAQLLTRIGAFVIALSPNSTELSFTALDRAQWHALDGRSFYWAYEYHHDERQLVVTPPFRNALSDVDRLATLFRITSSSVDPNLRTLGFPGTRRYPELSAEERLNNKVGIACLMLFAGGGISEFIRPPASWGDLSSLGS